MSKIKVPLSRKDEDRDVKNGSIDKMKESPKTIRVDGTRDKLRKNEEEVWNCGFSDNGSLDNLTSRNNDI